VPHQPSEDLCTRATAHLPGLDIEIVHQRSPSADAEQISINLRAMPSFEAFGKFLETTNPFAFWANAARIAWLPWLGATRVLTTPLGSPPTQPKLGGPDNATHPPERD
jgi:hypothetical protein